MNKEEAIKLASPAPLNDGGKKLSLFYLIGLAGAILGLRQGCGGMMVLGMVGLWIGYVIKSFILENRLYRLRRLRFHVDSRLSTDELIGRLIPVLTPLGMVIEKNGAGNPMITYQGLMYDVDYADDTSFTLYWRKSVLKAICGFKRLGANYRKAVVAMGIIAYHIQQASMNFVG